MGHRQRYPEGDSGGDCGDSGFGGWQSGAQARKNAVENNSLSDIAQAQSECKTLEQKAGEPKNF
ncbi:VENN motif pre-toxin domain-containing protein [Pantoea sp. WEP]|uniref:VENN motif pre-toxin domain-containing protein n=1 Tax=Pantoea sp. WEP TaxID=3230025 RepID=UPI0035679AA6